MSDRVDQWPLVSVTNHLIFLLTTGDHHRGLNPEYLSCRLVKARYGRPGGVSGAQPPGLAGAGVCHSPLKHCNGSRDKNIQTRPPSGTGLIKSSGMWSVRTTVTYIRRKVNVSDRATIKLYA